MSVRLLCVFSVRFFVFGTVRSFAVGLSKRRICRLLERHILVVLWHQMFDLVFELFFTPGCMRTVLRLPLA